VTVRTHTHVHYFTVDQVEPLALALIELGEDWEQRRPHVGATAREDGDDRLKAAQLAVKRLVDVVPE
jgi:hypothetical protein